MSTLKMQGLGKVYPSGAVALYNINLETSPNEFVVIVGGEKSGKSSLLRVVAGIEEASMGTVQINGKDMTGVDPKDRDIAMIFQGNSLYPSLNVFDNIGYGLRIRGASKVLVEQRVTAVAEILGITDLLYRKPKVLTAEQKQKVAIGRAIAREPQLYLFDDSFSGFDGKLRDEMRNIVLNLQARMNGTFLYATKSVQEAMSLATRVVVLKEGMVQQIDTPANLYDYPANAYVAFYIGSPTINFVNGATLEESADGVVANCGAFQIALSQKVVNRLQEKDAYVGTGKKVILGIRPEDIAVGSGTLAGKVTNVEEIEGTSFVDCDVHGTSFVGVGTAQKGAEVQLSYDAEHIYLFDHETRLTILGRDEGYQKTAYADADFQPMTFAEEQSLKEKIKKASKTNSKKK